MDKPTDTLQLKINLALYKEAYEAAAAFIDSHVADPDITPVMCQTYATYKMMQERLKELLVSYE